MNYLKLLAISVFAFIINAWAAVIIVRGIVAGRALIFDYLLLIPVVYFALRLAAYTVKFALLARRG